MCISLIEKNRMIVKSIFNISTTLVIAAVFTIASSLAADAVYAAEPGIKVSGFKWYMELVPENSSDSDSKGVVAFRIPESLYPVSNKDLRDLRIFDSRGAAVPFAIINKYSYSKKAKVPFSILNKGTTENLKTVLTMDFGSPVLKTDIEINTSGTDFRREVQIEGRNDLYSQDEPWIIMADDARLYNTGREIQNRIKITPNTFRYIRLNISAMAEESNAPSITEIKVFRTDTLLAPDNVPFSPVDFSLSQNGRESILELDLATPSAPVRSLRLKLDSRFNRVFNRSYRLHGRDSIKHNKKLTYETGESGPSMEYDTPWKQLESGKFIRRKHQRNTNHINITGKLNYRYLKFHVNNGDDYPLPIVSAEVKYHDKFIVFEPSGTNRLYLYGGSEEIQAASFGSASMLSEEWPWSLNRWTGEDIKPIAQNKGKPDSNNWLPNLALFISVFASAALLFKQPPTV